MTVPGPRKQPSPLDLQRLRVLPLARRKSLSAIDTLLVDPQQPPPACAPDMAAGVEHCARRIQSARERGASVLLIYGAHLVKNGLHRVVMELISNGWVTHLATNGAGVIHDWELAFQGRTEESVRANVATGTFGTWDETGRHILTALLSGGLDSLGFGGSVGRFVLNDGASLPSAADLESWLRAEPAHPLSPARADLLQAVRIHGLPAGRIEVPHPWKSTCILARAARLGVPFTVHPGIGYDIITNHPMFNGAVVGRAAELDFRLFGGSVEGLDDGVVLSVGSAIMAPQVFEKSLSCVNNLRLQAGRPVVAGHSFYVVDIQDGGCWDWSQGEPPKDNPAYYLRFCKSFARMGGGMRYVQGDNGVFLGNLLHRLRSRQ
jgi:hypothetical protein